MSKEQWDAWRRRLTYRIELGEIELPDYWVVCRSYFSFTEAEMAWLTEVGPNPETMPPDTVRKYLAQIIQDWNLDSPITGEPLKLPRPEAKGREKVIDEILKKHIPLDVQLFLARKVGEEDRKFFPTEPG